MEILIKREDLLKELIFAKGVTEESENIPILNHVLIEPRKAELRITSTDLDIALRASCPAEIVSPGQGFAVPRKKLRQITESLPEGAQLLLTELPDLWLSVTCGSVSFKIPGLPHADFPALVPEEEAFRKAGSPLHLPAAVIRDLIARTSFAITTEDARYYLAGALFIVDKDLLTMVATDGHRLAHAAVTRPSLVDLGSSKRREVLLPRKVIHQVAKMVETEDSVTFRGGDTFTFFEAGGRLLSSKPIEGKFPHFEKVVAVESHHTLVLDRERLQAAIRRVKILSSERSRCVRLELSPKQLVVRAATPDLGEAHERLDVAYDGARMEIGFEATYLLDFLAVAGSAEIHLGLTNSESQGTFRPIGEGPSYTYVVMPMRL